MAENFFGITDTGKVRGNNEDAFIAGKAMDNKFIIACVIDGVGGYSGGEVAADIAREAILKYTGKPAGNIISMMKEAFYYANDKIFTERQQIKDHDSMACVLTLAAVDVENNQFYYAHVGDTRLYLLRDGSLVKISKDHSFVGFMEETGRLSEEAAMRHPKRNEINKALGFGGNIQQDDYIETGQSPFLPGDMIMLCSDGLTDMVDKSTITSVLLKTTSLQEKANELVTEANNRGGKDNITVVLVHNNKAQQQYEATMPAALKKKDTVETPERAETEASKVSPAPQDIPLPKKQPRGLIVLLALLCITFLGTTLWLLWQRNNKSITTAQTSAASAVQRTMSRDELQLRTSITGLTGNVLVLSDSVFPKPVYISRALLIQQDTLFIKTKGTIVLLRDSAYKGPALQLGPACKLVMLDSLEFRNFDIAVSAANNALLLKNVRFTNCRIPLQTAFTFPAKKYISGRISNTWFTIDSLPQPRR